MDSAKNIHPFGGFPAGKTSSTRVPDAFFSELLPLIDDLAELKLTVYCFWALQQREGEFRYIRRQDMITDAILLRGFNEDPVIAANMLSQALTRAVQRQTLLHILLALPTGEDDHLYFMNTDKGRKAIEALERGDWEPGSDDLPVMLVPPRPNIFALYEQNIGPLTPLLSDILRDAEQQYPQEWIEEAIQTAVERNIRNWKYVDSILKRWFSEGKKDARSVRADAQKDRSPSSDFKDYERFWDAD